MNNLFFFFLKKKVNFKTSNVHTPDKPTKNVMEKS